MSAPGSTVSMDEYHAALDRRESRIAKLKTELRNILEWAATERAPLREQELESIRKVLAET